MGFWDDLNKSLGYDPPKKGDLWQQLKDETNKQPTSLFEGIQPESLEPLSAPSKGPHQMDVAEAFSLLQSRTRGFNTVEITPQRLPAALYPCSNTRAIQSLLGDEGENNVLDVLFNNWRTVPVQLQGNFLKVEFLPPKVNMTSFLNTDAATPGLNGVVTQEDHTFSANTTTGFGPESFPHDQAPSNTGRFSTESSRNVLVQFEENTAPLLIAKNGDIFKTTFNIAYIHVKTCAPRIRITTGFNSEIIESGDVPIQNMDLALGGAAGLWNHSSRHAVPWIAMRGGNFASGGAIVVGAGGSDSQIIFDQRTFLQPAYSGVAVLWLTDIDLSIAYNVVGNVMIGSLGLQIQDQNNNRIRTVAYIPIMGNGGLSSANISKSFSTPRRIVLAPGWKLRCTITAITADTNWNYSLHGYAYGGPGADPVTPISSPGALDGLTEHPYPLDNVIWQGA